MANQEQLNILKQGVQAWNEWREKQPDIMRLDLSGASLLDADLSGAKLSFAFITPEQLEEAIKGSRHVFPHTHQLKKR